MYSCAVGIYVRLTFRLTRAARSHDTPERGNTGHARAGPVRRVQPGVIRLVERGLLTDERRTTVPALDSHQAGARPEPRPPSFAPATKQAMVAPRRLGRDNRARRVTRWRC